MKASATAASWTHVSGRGEKVVDKPYFLSYLPTTQEAAMKKKVSFSIDQDVLELLERTANKGNVPASGVAEAAIRWYCGDQVPHRIEVDCLDDSSVTVHLEAQGQVIYRRSTHRRHGPLATVEGTVTIDLAGPVEVATVRKLLRELPPPAKTAVRSGMPIRVHTPHAEIVVSNVPIAATGNPAYVLDLVQRAAAAVEAMEITGRKQMVRKTCPTCGREISTVYQWAAGARVTEEEWVCGVGHRTDLGSGSQ